MNPNNNLILHSCAKIYIARFTGVALLLFIVGHTIGNLQIFLGSEAVNSYANFWHGNTGRLWLIRFVFLVILVLHVWSSVFRTVDDFTLVTLNQKNNQLSDRPSHVSVIMIVSGMIIIIFLVYHLLHLSVQVGGFSLVGSDFPVLHEVLADGSLRRDVYSMMILGFRNPVVLFLYLFGVGFLCVHLTHGLASLMQSLGSKCRNNDPAIERWSKAIACLVFLGYAAVPFAVVLGLCKYFV